MAKLDHTIQIIQTLERHGRKIEELMKRVKELEAKLEKRGPGRPPNKQEAA